MHDIVVCKPFGRIKAKISNESIRYLFFIQKLFFDCDLDVIKTHSSIALLVFVFCTTVETTHCLPLTQCKANIHNVADRTQEGTLVSW